MTKGRVEDMSTDESFKNKKCDKTKIKLGINRDKVSLFHLDELSNYYYYCFARKIKYLEFISVK